MRKKVAALALGISLLALGATSPAFSQAPAVNASSAPAKGTPQRAAIMDVVRPAVEADLGTSVEFVISCAAVSQGRSYVIAEPQRRGGGKIRYSEEDFPFGITVTASLAFREGRWRLLEHVIGDSDVWYFDGAPPSLRKAKCY